MNTIFERPIVSERLPSALPPCKAPEPTKAKFAGIISSSQRKQSSACKPVSAVRADQAAEKADSNTLQLIADITRCDIQKTHGVVRKSNLLSSALAHDCSLAYV